MSVLWPMIVDVSIFLPVFSFFLKKNDARQTHQFLASFFSEQEDQLE